LQEFIESFPVTVHCSQHALNPILLLWTVLSTR